MFQLSEFERLAMLARQESNRLTSTAQAKHMDGWAAVLASAVHGGYAKYGIYGSRILAVPHPEVYLRADAFFWQIASTVRGFKDAYGISFAADMYMMQWSRWLAEKKPLGDPLTWGDIPADAYSVVLGRAHYPDGYPFFPFLDLRMAPLAVSLKVWGKRVSAAELAEHYYFRAKAAGEPAGSSFVIVCDDESAYLARGGELLSMLTRQTAKATTGNPVLIFNEESVWYPLMDRDDSAKSEELSRLVHRLKTDTVKPELSEVEQGFVRQLKEVGRLHDPRQFDMAMLAALRATGIDGDPYVQVWERSVVPHRPRRPWLCDRKMGIIRECDRYANYLSPAAANLAGLVVTAPTEEVGIRALSGEYLKYAGVMRNDEVGWKKPGRLEAWGHVWYCPLMEYTIDDAYRAAGGHCVSQSMNLSAALDLAGVDHYVTHFNLGGSGTASHHFVSSSDAGFVLDDGMVNYFETGVRKTDDWGCLLSFSKAGLWASLAIDEYFGNVSPADVLGHVEAIERLIGGRFGLNFLNLTGGDEVQPKDRFLRFIGSVKDWRPIELP